MQFSTAAIAAFSLNVLLATAAPTEKRQSTVASVLMCTDINSSGNCQTQEIPLSVCTGFSNGFAGQIKSVDNQSSGSGIKCTWFLEPDCSGSTYTNQDDQNLTDGNGDFASMVAASCSA